MPNENADDATSVEAPIASFSAADAFAALSDDVDAPQAPIDEDEEVEQASEVTPIEEETDEGEEKDKDPESDPEGKKKSDEEKPKENEDEDPQLDPLLAKLLSKNPEGMKRLSEIEKGVEKLKSQRDELREKVAATSEKATLLDQYNEALASKEFAGPTLRQLITATAKSLGVSESALLGDLGATKPKEEANLLPEVDESGRKRPDWERRGYDSPKEMELDQKYEAVMAELAGLKSEREQRAAEAEKAKKQADFKNYVESIADNTIKTLEKTNDGWKVSAEMVRKAIEEFPQLVKDPVKAVKAAYPDELAAHKLAQANKSRKSRGPELPADARGRGKTVQPPGTRLRAADIFAELNS